MFIGTAIALMLHGVTCCQMIWFFRNQPGRSSKSLIAFVIFVWLAELLNCLFMFLATLDMFFLPAVIYATNYTSPCTDWVARAQTIPETLCTLAVEGFFIMRMWRLSEHKKLAMLAFIPYLASYSFSFAQISRSFQLRCDPDASDLNLLFVYGVYGFRIFLDSVVVATMCYMLYTRSSGLSPQQYQYYEDCAWAYFMVDFNWRVDVDNQCSIPTFPWGLYTIRLHNLLYYWWYLHKCNVCTAECSYAIPCHS